MEWKLQFIASAFYLAVNMGGFILIPREPPMFGMGMIPGPLALFSAFGLPLIAAFGIAVAVYRTSKARRGINTAFFFVCALIIWVSAFVLSH